MFFFLLTARRGTSIVIEQQQKYESGFHVTKLEPKNSSLDHALTLQSKYMTNSTILSH